MFFKVMNYIDKNKDINKIELAQKFNVSLDEINEILEICIRYRYIYRNKEYKNNRYILSQKGKNYLKNNMNLDEIGKYEKHSIDTAVILIAGQRKDFDCSVASLDIEGVSVIRRMINILKENGIKYINIVIGYGKERIIKDLDDESDIRFIVNDKFKWTGSMASLAKVKEYISSDFILVEGDIVIEDNAIKSLLKSNNRDELLITNESGSGDEGFVQLRDKYLFKLGKDIHQFNKIDGEMIGISKISYELFNIMLREYEGNVNPYLNYEYILMDVARNYRVSCLKIDDLAWGEIDNLHQYNRIKNYIFPRIKRKNIISEKEDIKRIIKECLKLKKISVFEITRIGGMTNRNYKINVDGELMILRLPGIGTEKIIDRKNEVRNSKLVSEKQFDAKILYINEETGVKISKFIEGAETLTVRSAKKENNIKLVANLLYTLHNSNIHMTNKFDVYREIRKYENIIDKYNYNYYEGYKDIREKIFNIKSLMKKYNTKIVPSHNDTLPDNFIKDNNERLYLIDWEYSGLNDNMWDVAAYCLESNFSTYDEELFLHYYCADNLSKDDSIRLLMNKVLQDILWSLWTIVKEKEGENYGDYGIYRYNRGILNLNKLYMLI